MGRQEWKEVREKSWTPRRGEAGGKGRRGDDWKREVGAGKREEDGDWRGEAGQEVYRWRRTQGWGRE